VEGYCREPSGADPELVKLYRPTDSYTSRHKIRANKSFTIS